jgi:hypothetical protein
MHNQELVALLEYQRPITTRRDKKKMRKSFEASKDINEWATDHYQDIETVDEAQPAAAAASPPSLSSVKPVLNLHSHHNAPFPTVAHIYMVRSQSGSHSYSY